MKRLLKHPINSIREPFGTAGLIVAMIALLAALGGTALAAAKLNSTQKKEVEKIAKKFAGKPGANGVNGTNGSPGAKGDPGAPGSNGTNGTPGVNGKSIVVANATSQQCEAGGKTLEVEGSGTKSPVCNGKNGAIQPGETLPKGASETGTFGNFVSNGVILWAPISFPIPLAAPLGTSQIHYMVENGSEEWEEEVEAGEPLVPQPACPGSYEAPAAEEGTLCLYKGSANNVSLLGAASAVTVAGDIPSFSATGTIAFIAGTWAVTAE